LLIDLCDHQFIRPLEQACMHAVSLIINKYQKTYTTYSTSDFSLAVYDRVDPPEVL